VRGEDRLEAAAQVIRGWKALERIGFERGEQQPRQILGRVTLGAHLADRPAVRRCGSWRVQSW
jgi:hypothetical protein